MAISRMQQPRQMYQEGGIMPRLNQLGSGVSSAEQTLQEINQRLESAESNLGEGGATAPIGSGSIRPFESGTEIGSGNLFELAGGYNTLQRPALNLLQRPSQLPSVQTPDPFFGNANMPSELGPALSPMSSAMRNMAASGGMMGRQNYGLGSLVKKAVKGVTGAVKKIAGSDLGKAALLIGGGMIPFGQTGTSLFGRMASSPILSGILESKAAGKIGGVLKDVAIGTGVTGLTDYLTRPDELPKKIGGRSTQEINQVVSQMKENYRNLGYEEGEIDLLIEDFVQQNYPGYNRSEGGRIGFAGGTNEDFQKYLEGREKFEKQKNYEQLYKEFLENKRRQEVAEQKTMAANGGRIGYAFGSPEENAIQASGIMGLPLNENPAGVTELDLRETGGFIPPVGVKEKADDIPAMLSNNEFVMTADAVREFGDGDVNKGAERMYAMMKKLENGGRV